MEVIANNLEMIFSRFHKRMHSEFEVSLFAFMWKLTPEILIAVLQQSRIMPHPKALKIIGNMSTEKIVWDQDEIYESLVNIVRNCLWVRNAALQILETVKDVQGVN